MMPPPTYPGVFVREDELREQQELRSRRPGAHPRPPGDSDLVRSAIATAHACELVSARGAQPPTGNEESWRS
jgi:hypothetical protein